jgi:diguanylate cyclase (GGDEF)-like protein/PAS domain S-box-containing protein
VFKKIEIQKIHAAQRRKAVWIAVIYALLVGLWVLVSSGLPFALLENIEIERSAPALAAAGLFFVFASSWLLYLLIVNNLMTARQSEEAMRLRDRAIESSVNAIVITNHTKPDNPIEYVNPAFERITGYAAAEVIGRNCRFLSREDRDQPEIESIRAAIHEESECHVVLRNYRKDGSLFWNDLSIAPVRDHSGRVTHFIGVQNDITETKRYQDELERQANYDALTGLPNRSLLQDRLKQAIAFAQRQNHSVAVAFIDLDRFKFINDSLGHNAGDRLLQTVAERIKSCLRQFDTVARYAGDEFVLVLYDQLSEETISALLQRVLDNVSKPFQIDKQDVYVTCSIGVSVFPQDGREVGALLKNADAAMFRAKERGRNNFRFYTAEMNSRVAEHLSLETDLRRALERGELLLHYQPQVDLPSGRIVGAEALARWQHPQKGMIAPGRFIPLAEETGLILPLGEWVLQTACTQNKAWRDAGLPPVTMSVNISVRQFMRKDLIESLAKVIEASGLDARQLELEVTESLIMHNAEEFVATLRKLRAIGIKLAIDDFGTGYSSLNYLKQLPVDRLKVDQSFVRDIFKDAGGATIAEAIITLGHSLGLKVIAEGVETGEQLDFLRHKLCDEFQGYYFSRPLPADKFTALLQAEQRRVAPLGSQLA